MQGECLCGAVKFEINQPLGNVYQCHCSLCRKVSGSHANSATFVEQRNFNWLSGQQFIQSYQKPTGFRSDFCHNCGSFLPNPIKDSTLMWLPMGLLNDDESLNNSNIAVKLHENSKAVWDNISDTCHHFGHSPNSLQQLTELLQLNPNH